VEGYSGEEGGRVTKVKLVYFRLAALAVIIFYNPPRVRRDRLAREERVIRSTLNVSGW
jgi:hypothetical protein